MTDPKDTNMIRRCCSPSKKLKSDWDKEEIASHFCFSGLCGFEVDSVFVFKLFDLIFRITDTVVSLRMRMRVFWVLSLLRYCVAVKTFSLALTLFFFPSSRERAPCAAATSHPPSSKPPQLRPLSLTRRPPLPLTALQKPLKL